jgi:hypothetical protein
MFFKKSVFWKNRISSFVATRQNIVVRVGFLRLVAEQLCTIKYWFQKLYFDV